MSLLQRAKMMPSRKAAGIHAHDKWGFLYITPFFSIFLLFGLLPILFTVYLAFFHWELLSDANYYVGFQNFSELMKDPYFWIAVRNTFSIFFISFVPQTLIALALAVVLANPHLKFAMFWRTILLIPWITSVLAVGIVFSQLFGREFGMINVAMQYLGLPHVDWVGGTIPSQIAIATMINWRWIGYNALIYLAAILAIPKELYESAEIDGASKWQVFIFVTIPQLRNTLTFMLVVGTIGGLQTFLEPLIYGGSTGGDSRQFSTLTLYLFEQAFINGRFGYAAAIGIAITVIVVIISFINFLASRKIAGEESKR